MSVACIQWKDCCKNCEVIVIYKKASDSIVTDRQKCSNPEFNMQAISHMQQQKEPIRMGNPSEFSYVNEDGLRCGWEVNWCKRSNEVVLEKKSAETMLQK